MSRVYKHKAKQIFQAFAKEKGWRISGRGWPDFVLYNSEEKIIGFVVVLAENRRELRKDQKPIIKLACEKGINCFVFSPNSGLIELREGERGEKPTEERGVVKGE